MLRFVLGALRGLYRRVAYHNVMKTNGNPLFFFVIYERNYYSNNDLLFLILNRGLLNNI